MQNPLHMRTCKFACLSAVSGVEMSRYMSQLGLFDSHISKGSVHYVHIQSWNNQEAALLSHIGMGSCSTGLCGKYLWKAAAFITLEKKKINYLFWGNNSLLERWEGNSSKRGLMEQLVWYWSGLWLVGLVLDLAKSQLYPNNEWIDFFAVIRGPNLACKSSRQASGVAVMFLCSWQSLRILILCRIISQATA